VRGSGGSDCLSLKGARWGKEGGPGSQHRGGGRGGGPSGMGVMRGGGGLERMRVARWLLQLAVCDGRGSGGAARGTRGGGGVRTHGSRSVSMGRPK
jgi:hypothetical protein